MLMRVFMTHDILFEVFIGPLVKNGSHLMHHFLLHLLVRFREDFLLSDNKKN